MTKRCCVCGIEFEADKKSRVTCNSAECKHIHHLAYMREYDRKRRKEKRKAVNEYNRQWMQKQRAKEAEAIRQGITADGYAERQIARTLALAGKVQI